MQDSLASDGDSDALTWSSSGSEQEQQQGDLVVQGFARLCKNYNPGKYHEDRWRAHRWAKGEGFQPDELDLRKEFLKRLRSSLLPLLREQITSLSHLLDPTRLRIESESTLELILEKQSELDTTLHEIEDALENIRSEEDPYTLPESQDDDQHLKEFKGFRIAGLDNCLRDLLIATTSLFKQSQKNIQQLELSTEESQSSSSNSDSEESQSSPTDIASIRKQIIDSASSSSVAAGCMIKWIEGSDIQLVQSNWSCQFRFIDAQMEELLKSISLPANPGESDESFKDESAVLSKLFVELAPQALPLMKLCRLFFNKLSNNGMNSKRLPFYTDMSSAQLTDLFELLGKVAGNVRQIVVWLKSIRGSMSMPIGIDWLFSSAQMLKKCLEPQLPLVSSYLVPLVPDTSGFSAQTHYKDWLIFWLAQLGVATQNFLDAINLFVKSWNSYVTNRQ
ncbi:hypothetical protein MJO28_012191 [Puccinia striiformis f. sp. tritici]|uniref:Uncharacterized protein n=1 Tax=Puccinia striiformis f. sp. tritici TaxID=168172 RepID=A0ACC0E161_9BASI|nr:hypothetical protein Pst134EB_023786 [Puccinia striiformis f. sp. tritici]KAI7942164.1 hypothetical protein MJO28_012191 [Puccinia striiformis f. sp. tritici]KAI9606072.1 hypothetical protein H4Q26_004445 [Puccinia striiformis f. sp. tritici PST-130]